MISSKLFLLYLICHLTNGLKCNEKCNDFQKNVLSSVYDVMNNRKTSLTKRQSMSVQPKIWNEKRNKRYSSHPSDYYEEPYPSYHDYGPTALDE
jgi:hypothetical protein